MIGFLYPGEKEHTPSPTLRECWMLFLQMLSLQMLSDSSTPGLTVIPHSHVLTLSTLLSTLPNSMAEALFPLYVCLLCAAVVHDLQPVTGSPQILVLIPTD